MTTRVESDLQVLTDDTFYRVGPNEFGTPGLLAIESVGPFVELARLGPFITIHDALMEPSLGIGHHPHRSNERLFYILRGRIEHDDALNGIRDTMHEGDLARLTEGERGMLHREWNGRDDIATHAFILVYTPDVQPPIELASFNALRTADVPVVGEADGVTTRQLIGGDSSFGASSSAVRSFFDSSLSAGATLDVTMPPNEGLLMYPIEGAVRLDGVDRPLRATSDVHDAGPDAAAVAWSGPAERRLQLAADGGAARVLRIGFGRGERDLVMHRPWRSRA